AGKIAVGESVHKPALYFDANLVKTLALLDVVLANGPDTFLFSSTAAVYESRTSSPMTYDAPVPVTTAGIVLMRIFRSRPSDQLSMYARSSRIHSSNATSLRPDVCHKPVIPGRIESLRRCHGAYCSTSAGRGGRGPTRLMDPT